MNILTEFSPLWQRLGHTALQFLWQGAALAAIALLIKILGHRWRPQLRYAAYCLVLLLMLAAPVVVFWDLGKKVNPVGGSGSLGSQPREEMFSWIGGFVEDLLPEHAGSKASSTTTTPAAATAAVVQEQAPTPEGNRHWSMWCGFLWVLGSLVCAVPRVAGWFLLQSWKAQAVPANATLLALLHHLGSRLGLAANQLPKLLVSNKTLPPFSAGWLRPYIMLPLSLITHLPREQLEALLAHELAHIRRGDYLVNLGQHLAESVLFFHPVVWWLNREIRKERELLCDAEAVASLGQARPLAEALGGLAEWQSAPQLVQAANHQPLLLRIQRLMGAPDIAPSKLTLALPLLLLGGFTLWPVFGQETAEKPENTAPSTGEAAKVVRGRILDRNGVVLAESKSLQDRTYPLGSLFSHTVGYTAWSGAWEKSPMVGRYAAEKGMDAALAAGKDVKLALDAKCQMIARNALIDGKIGRGSAVIMDPKTGEILAMVSVPDFAPAKFFPKVKAEDFDALQNDPTKPLSNRALHGNTPSSAFKAVVALSAVAEGATGTIYNCGGKLLVGDRAFHCWISQKGTSHGGLDLDAALKKSCNCYFYQLGAKLGPDKIAATANILGMNGKRLSVLGNAHRGYFPTSAQFEMDQKQPMAAGDLANLSIGQGHAKWNLVHAATLASTIANGGKVWSPVEILESEGQRTKPQLQHDFATTQEAAEGLERIRKGMLAVVNDVGGTGVRASSKHFKIAGKTGTAQVWVKDKPNVPELLGTFIGYAPANAPEHVVVVQATNVTSSGTACAPVAKRILEDLHFLKQGQKTPQVVPTEPVAGHLKQVGGGAAAEEK